MGKCVHRISGGELNGGTGLHYRAMCVWGESAFIVYPRVKYMTDDISVLQRNEMHDQSQTGKTWQGMDVWQGHDHGGQEGSRRLQSC